MSKKQYCSHCKNMQKGTLEELDYKTHSIKDCPKLKNTTCFNCHEVGHTPKYCTKPKEICILCQQMGHSELKCGYQSQILATSVSFRKPYKNLGFEPKSWLGLNQEIINKSK